MIKGVSLIIGNNIYARLYKSGCSDVDWENVTPHGDICIYDDGKGNGSGKSYFEYKESDLNIAPLRLKETVRYSCVIWSENEFDYSLYMPSLRNMSNKFLKVESEKNHFVFQFINYLGKAELSFGNKSLTFEVVPDKINYETDYVNLTEAIAEECAALLLDYSSPTSLTFAQDPVKQYKSALEQFIFLRQFCYAENFESLFASIKRNPDRMLVEEDELKPFGQGIPSKRFFTNPFTSSRGWNDLGNGMYLPSEIASTHKYDSFDTPANRFLKFALNTFNDICSIIVDRVDSSQSVYYSEALLVKSYVEDILKDSFFDDVQDLTVMPVNNQVLEKREGYSQIFRAFSMVDLALQLDWKGKEDVYSGEAKNTALLYEYWLFFELRKIISGIDECKCVQSEDNPFITDKDGLTISLRQDRMSKQEFETPNQYIVLYYTDVAVDFIDAVGGDVDVVVQAVG